MRTTWLALSLLAAPLSPALAQAQFSLHLGGPGVSLGIVMPVVPELVQVPGAPVYYAPRAHANYFFFDGVYWVFHADRWYASAGYDGPWHLVAPEYVPAYVLRVPVRYYRAPPAYFRGWRVDDSPRWDQRWGREWEHRRAGWDRRDGHAPRPVAWPAPPRDDRGDRRPRALERSRAVALERDHGPSRDDGHARGVAGGDRGRGAERGRDGRRARDGDGGNGHGRGHDD